jgi:thermolabile hemolysin
MMIRFARTWHVLLFLILGCLLPWHAHAKGGDTQPARTLGERGLGGTACDTGLQELTGCGGDDCQGSSSRCFRNANSWRVLNQCGTAGFRACPGWAAPITINGDAVRACAAGLTEITGCNDYPNNGCAGSSSRCFESLAQYQQLQGCGGAAQRGCTGGERPTINGVTGQACSAGFEEGALCKGDDCRGSSSRCFESLAAYQQFQRCGGSTQRGCTAVERPTIKGVTGLACRAGFEEAGICVGDDCNGSSSRCYESLAAYQQFQGCGAANQRACTLGERLTIGGITGGACRTSDLLEVSGCDKDCRGSNTHCELKSNYTYVRCYYKKSARAASVDDVDYVWALEKNSENYYALQGYWYGQFGVAGANIFYTGTSQQDIRDICGKTLARKGQQRPAGFFAADTNISFNYTIWTNDPEQPPRGVNKIVVFGDSLSDTGNMFNLTNWRLPIRTGWYLGRFSNGPVWVEYLAERLKVPLYNWAFGGAKAQGNKLPIPRLGDQVDSWQAYMREAKNYAPANSLFVVLIGANDITGSAGNVPALSADVESGLKKLVDLGATRIVLLNLPDIARSPEVQNANKARAPEITADVDQYNANLVAIADRIRNLPSRPALVLFDAHDLIGKLLSQPGDYGFRVTDRQCLRIDWLDWNLIGSAKYAAPHWASEECAKDDAQGWVFWDGSHPTTAAHKLLADEVSKVIKPILQ